ncbi:MAG: hypothetical protein PHW36_00625 [Bacilli bacterium]|nr:hypothetical protein [Bacilli bacterium]
MDIDSDKDLLPMVCVHCRLDCANCCPIDDFLDGLNDRSTNQLFALQRRSREIITIDDIPKGGYTDKHIRSSIISPYLIQQNRQNPSQITFETIGKYPLLQPILFDIIYDPENDLFCLTNEELALYGYGKNYVDVIESLEGEIEGHALFFTRYPPSDHTKDSLLIKKKLEEYINFEQILSYLKERDGEN